MSRRAARTGHALVLRPGRERSLERRHPWVFSGGVGHVHGDPGPGDTVVVRRPDGHFMAWAAYSPVSQIRARVWSFDEDDVIDEAFITRRVHEAAARRGWLQPRSNGLRLVFAESDGLPGVTIDRYDSVAVCELTSTGADRWRHEIARALLALDGIETVIERADAPVRVKEGLDERSGLLAGAPAADDLTIVEHLAPGRSMVLGVDVTTGHKTGCYLDQRDNRAVVSGLSAGRRVLDVCTYTGGFATAAALGGAVTVAAIDSSGPALEMAARNLTRNGVEAELIEADAFAELRRMRDGAQRFDLVVLDPPKLAASERQVDRASRAYKDLNLSALKLIDEGGFLVTFSCSGAVSEDLFQKIVFGAALDAGREVRIVQRLSQAGDHPVLLDFPEAAYLKGLVCQVGTAP